MAGDEKKKKTRRGKEPKTCTSRESIDEDDGTQVESRQKAKKTRKPMTRRTRQPTNRDHYKPLQDTIAHQFLRTFCLETNKKGVDGLLEEFNAIKAETIAKPPMTAQTTNLQNGKNRYGDVCCTDATRVVLKWPPGGSDYIHANWIDYRGKRDFICTQGPTVDSIDDFWRMIWQEKCKAIVMLCEIMEQGRRKCEPYWPSEKDGVMCTKVGLKVKNLGIERHEEAMLTVAKLQVSSDSGGEPLEVTHIKWNNWPDRGAPSNKLAPFLLLKQLQDKAPVVVHCSAGIGRTGTIVAIDMALQTVNAKESLNMATVVKELRSKRHGSVQMDVQYLYIHRSLMEYAKNISIVTGDQIEPFCIRYDAFMQSRG
ncbi:protein-tyrosine phosphatase domain-containing protein [Ditylenchus destructor]|uniref:Protein-tyrosine phosphatase domain-containing protein n=1 Tax=Ditylenchus destructor TaxID=166010 RepID=A0AAD4NHH2_9BILA|nr:protein-tyrosine phosphatase domain-containing protein [Ditylenchus destructor]